MKKPNNDFESRISAGILKNKKLLLPDDAEVRPTRLRVRQAVFNMLFSRLDLAGLNVVELCCGSGAWGLEAYSRGAAHVTLVDTRIETAKKNIANFGVEKSTTLVKSDVLHWSPTTRPEVLLSDPPYRSGIAQKLMHRRDLLGKPGCWWVIGVATEEPLDWTGFTEVTEKVYGVSKIGIGQQL